MPTLLVTSISVTLASHAESTVVHGINMEGAARVPNIIRPDRLTSIGVKSISDTTITFRNYGATSATALFYVELTHSIQRPFSVNTFGPYDIWQGSSFAPVGPVDLGGARTFIYVRLTGSDTTGTGTLALPYRTFGRALQDIPLAFSDGQFFIDVTDMGNINTGAAGYSLPAYSTNADMIYNLAPEYPAFYEEGSVNIRAIPTTLDTITAADSPSRQARGYLWNMVVTTSPPRWTPGEFKGKLLIGATGTCCAIADNDATTLELCMGGNGWQPSDLPYVIAEPSATFVNTQGAVPLCIDNSTAPIALHGIGASAGNGFSSDFCFRFNSLQPIMILCTGESLLVSRFCNDLWMDSCAFVNVTQAGYAGEVDLRAQDSWGTEVLCSYFDAVSSPGPSYGPPVGSLYMKFQFCSWRNGCGPVMFGSPGAVLIWESEIDGSVSEGVRVNNGYFWDLYEMDISNCSASGIVVDGGYASVFSVSGTDNFGYGVELHNLASAYLNCTITGAVTSPATDVDLLIGAVPYSWTNFAGAAPVLDSGAGGTGSLGYT